MRNLLKNLIKKIISFFLGIRYTKKDVYYFDLDDTLTRFSHEKNAVERFRDEESFFYNLKPIKRNVAIVKQLIADGEKVYIITASPNKNCDRDKIAWVRKYVSTKVVVIIVRLGERKVDHMRTARGVLFDDYGKNCREWETNPLNKSYKVDARRGLEYWLKKHQNKGDK